MCAWDLTTRLVCCTDKPLPHYYYYKTQVKTLYVRQFRSSSPPGQSRNPLQWLLLSIQLPSLHSNSRSPHWHFHAPNLMSFHSSHNDTGMHLRGPTVRHLGGWRLFSMALRWYFCSKATTTKPLIHYLSNQTFYSIYYKSSSQLHTYHFIITIFFKYIYNLRW